MPALAALILIALVAVPLGFLLLASVKTVAPGHAGFLTSPLTADNYLRVGGSAAHRATIVNTLLFGLGATALALVIGTGLAFTAVRTDAPLRRAIAPLVYAQMIIPGFISSIAWIFLGSPRIGAVNVIWRLVSGSAEPLVSVYSLTGMILVQGLKMFPFVFITTSAALRSMDPSLEEACFTSGASIGTAARRVTLPLMRPAVAGAAILIFVHSLASLDVPLILGLPDRIFVLSTQIYLNNTLTPPDYGLSAAFGVVLLGAGAGLLLLYHRAIRRREAFMTVTGKGFRPRTIGLGPWRWPAAAASAAVLGGGVLAPLAMLGWASLQPFYSPPSMVALRRVTTANFVRVIHNATVLDGLRNSLLLAVGTSTFLVVLVAAAAWVVYRTKARGRVVVDFLAFAPQAIPSIVFGVAVMWLFLVLPIPIYGTVWIILFAYLGVNLPHAMRIVSSGLMQVHTDLEEAAQMSGGSWLMTFRRILLPLLRPALVSAWVWTAVHVFRDLDVSIILSSPRTQTVGVAVISLLSDGLFGVISAFSLIILALLVILSVIVDRLGRRFGVVGME